MTESEWLACGNPSPLLTFLGDKVSDRKIRLFACLCCRRIWDVLGEKGRLAVETAERYTDGLCSAAVAAKACSVAFGQEVWPATLNRASFPPAFPAAARAAFALSPRSDASEAPPLASQAEALCAGRNGSRAYHSVRRTARSFQAGLLRELVGNSCRPASFGPDWLTPTVANLAQAVYEESIKPWEPLDLERLAVLSDAVEEAGCDYDDILNHLRSPGPHVRGCWAVDLLLGKN
jgi:hypothetical protein